MKKFLFGLVVTLLLVGFGYGHAMATWTIGVSVADVKGHYVIYKLLCTSDGDSLTATDFVALMSDQDRRHMERGATMMVMNVDPGTGGVAPDATIDVTFTDITGIAVYAETTLSNVADTVGKDLSADLNQYPVMTTKMYITLNDIGASGDQVTFYLICWVE